MFEFTTTPYDKILLEPEMAEGLEQFFLQARDEGRRVLQITSELKFKKVEVSKLAERNKRQKTYGFFCLVGGLALFASAYMRPDRATGYLMMGAIAAVLGVACLIPRREGREMRNRAEEQAQHFFSKEHPSQVVKFDKLGMAVGKGDIIPFEQFRYLMELTDGYLLIYGDQIAVFQKKDVGNQTGFAPFVAGKTGLNWIKV